jgi:hypothetical protein
MMSSLAYRQKAEDCVRMAECAGSIEAKSFLMMLASAWHRLSQNVENNQRPPEGVEAARVERCDGR